MTATVRLEYLREFALVTLDRPQKLNALNSAMLEQLDDRLGEVSRSAARAVLITGAGDRAFCAGADLQEVQGRTVPEHHADTARGQRVFGAIADLPLPTVALVNGLALGGGLELALACDFRLCSPNAQLGCPEVKVGLLPAYGGTQRLPRIVGEAVALEMILSGDPVDAQCARETGLVSRIVDGDLLAAGLEFAERITRHSLVAVRLARAAVRRAGSVPLAEGLRSEGELSTLAYASEDAREGIEAFLTKRAPQFRDR